MRWLVLWIAGASAVAAQVMVFDRLAVDEARPDLALALSLLVALASRRLESACAAGWLIGLTVDLVSGARFGTFSLLFLAAALAACGLKQVVAGETAFGQVLVVGAVVLLAGALEALWVYGEIRGLGVGRIAWRVTGTALYTALLAPLLGALGKPLLQEFAKT
jgi:rod shape-determining protein MreD